MPRKPQSLDHLDLSARFKGDDAALDAALHEAEIRLLSIQQAYLVQGHRAVILFEGWDAAGKGGAIRRLTQKLDPRAVKVWPIAVPGEHEKAMPYLYRFWRRLPEPGTIAIFDRSWYGRVLVERVEKLIPPAAWKRAYGEINEFERLLADDGIRVIKFFLHVSREEQIRRFIERIDTPFKRWKLVQSDLQNLRKRAPYDKAIHQILAETDTDIAPWRLIPAESKPYARLRIMQEAADALSQGIDISPPKKDKKLLHELKKLAKKK